MTTDSVIALVFLNSLYPKHSNTDTDCKRYERLRCISLCRD